MLGGLPVVAFDIFNVCKVNVPVGLNGSWLTVIISSPVLFVLLVGVVTTTADGGELPDPPKLIVTPLLRALL